MDNIIVEEKEEAKLPVISYSKVNAYKTCPRAYKYTYIDKLPRQDKPYFAFGSFAHAILENFHKEFIDGSKELIEIVMKHSFIKALDEYRPKLTKEQIDEVFAIMQQYLDILAQKEKLPNVLHVEKKIWVEIDDMFILNGFIDRVQLDDDGVIHIADYKTTKDEKYLKDRMQLMLYAYIIYLEDKSLTKIRTSYIMLKHNMKSIVEEYNIDELIEAKEKLIDAWITIKNDKLFRAAPLSWKCKNCDFLSNCKEGQQLIFNKSKFGQTDW